MYWMKRFLTIALGCLVSISSLSAGTIHFDHININHGLSQNTITAILQDQRGFMWFGTRDGLNRYDGNTFKVFKHSPTGTSGLNSSVIRALAEDASGNIWIGTDLGLQRYSPDDESIVDIPIIDVEGQAIIKPVTLLQCDKDGFVYIAIEDNGVHRYNPHTSSLECCSDELGTLNALHCDKDGVVWFSEFGGGLFYTEDNFKTVKSFLDKDGLEIFPSDQISTIYFGEKNLCYLGLEKNGAVEINLLTGETRLLRLTGDKDERIFVRSMVQYVDDELWIGTESGIFIYNLRSNESQQLRHWLYDPGSLSDNAIYALFKDNEGGLWVGSYFGGLDYIPKRNMDFETFYQTNSNNSIQGQRVREICAAGDGSLWVGTEDSGLYSFEPETGTFKHFPPSSGFPNVHGLLVDGDRLWVSTFSNGIRAINVKSGAIRTYNRSTTDGDLFSDHVFALCKASDGRIYVGTMHGLQSFDTRTESFSYVPEINGGKMVNDIFEDSKGQLWVSTFANGLYVFNPRTEEWRQYLNDRNDLGSLPGNNVTGVFEDSGHTIWVTTEGSGFCRYDSAEDCFELFNSSDGMPSDVVFRIVEDNQRNFWITTNQGLVLFDPKQQSVKRIYTVADRLLSNQFNYKSSYISEKGKIYLGCIEGMVSFDPLYILSQHQEKLPPFYIIDFSLLDETIAIGSPQSPLQKSIMQTDTVRLRFSQNSISLTPVSLDYAKTHTSRLTYSFFGLDNQWRSYSPKSGPIIYSNLPPGKYTFRLKLANTSQSETKDLFIEVLPPFYLTTAAHISYCLLSIGLFLLVITILNQRSRRVQQERMKEFEREKERELYNAKINYFTNVAHEIRTPLTLVKGPLENILTHKKLPQELTEDLEIMDRNTNRLLDLTSQLLNFDKVEQGNLSLRLVRQDATSIISNVFYRFTSVAKHQGKSMVFKTPDFPLWVDVDAEAFSIIISNLINNAMKYSEKRICAELSMEDGQMLFRITNDGEIVPFDIREKIFTAFFRHTKKAEVFGKGIGLAFSRSLAELHNGSLKMDDSVEENTFVLAMPLSHNAVDAAERAVDAERPDASAPEESEESDHYDILVVEDDDEMCGFIANQLGMKYEVLTARNGLEALEILEDNYINLIVSDIMMPRMDGIEFLNRVKNDLRFSHIPVVLLTAKTNIQSKISGMENGADAYVEKPFSTHYLLSVIANLIRNREALWEAFNKNPLVHANSIATTNTDMRFIERMQEIVHENFNNPEFKINDLAEMMNMSRASFYRKVKVVLNVSPNDYLRIERLKAAAQLLKDDQYNVSEVCYMVGFNSTSYFSKCFKKQFGLLPGQFISENS